MKAWQRWLWLGLLAIALSVTWASMSADKAPPRLLLAPLFNALEPCIAPPTKAVANAPKAVEAWCGPGSDSLAPVVNATLSPLGEKLPLNPHFELGYTLAIPMLRLLERDDRDWKVNRPALRKMVRTLRQAERPAVVYLFSTHFGVHAPIERELAGDPENLLVSQNGALPADAYYGDDVFPWSFTTTDNPITQRRLQVVDAFVEEVCLLPEAARENIRAITMLGELHHMFPRLGSGMGYAAPYVITDYSDGSKRDFRRFLQLRFRSVHNLNAALGSSYSGFTQVEPPSKDIRTQTLTRYSEHIDAYAHGSFPVSGWVHVPRGASSDAASVRLYRNGEWVARRPVRAGRQDVAQAHPEFGTADVGWEFEVDFKSLPVGQHRLDIMLEMGADLVHLGSRQVAVMGRQQTPPPQLASKTLPQHRAADGSVQWSIDAPSDSFAYFYNPLVALWHEFRGQQVQRYLAYFDHQLRRSCLRHTPIFTHQILPFINPGWDKNRFAAEPSLRPFGPTHTGISLYGEATYGQNFPDWFAQASLSSYGVTEFHPLKAMSAAKMGTVLEQHRQRGARFLSFFVEPIGLTPGQGSAPNLFSFDPQREEFGSASLYEAVRTVLNTPPAP